MSAGASVGGQVRALRRADRCRPRCLGQSLCLLCTDSGVGLGTKGHPGGFLGVRAVTPIMAFGTALVAVNMLNTEGLTVKNVT